MTATQATEAEKMAAVAQVGMVLKSRMVAAEGIGTDIPKGVYAWKDNRLVASLQLSPEMTDELQIMKLTIACGNALRLCYGATALTLLCDGYEAVTESDEADPLRFASMDEGVEEVLVVVHIDKWEPHAGFLTVPYMAGVGRQVSYNNHRYKAIDIEGGYVGGLAGSLDCDPDASISPEAVKAQLKVFGVEMAVFE